MSIVRLANLFFPQQLHNKRRKLLMHDKINALVMKYQFPGLLLVATATAQLNQGSDCPVICPLSYAPLCAKNSAGDYETFSNECKLRAKNCNNKNGKPFFEI
jgi:hypothetical protein